MRPPPPSLCWLLRGAQAFVYKGSLFESIVPCTIQCAYIKKPRFFFSPTQRRVVYSYICLIFANNYLFCFPGQVRHWRAVGERRERRGSGLPAPPGRLRPQRGKGAGRRCPAHSQHLPAGRRTRQAGGPDQPGIINITKYLQTYRVQSCV